MIKWIKQLFCKHDWRIKGVGTYSGHYFKSTERRCCKCKKVDFKYELKL